MYLTIGCNYLITTDAWFIAPDGNNYRAVFGELRAIQTDAEHLGIQTNRHSSNWYIVIGNMAIAGCQVHYAIKTNYFNQDAPFREIEYKGELLSKRSSHRISSVYDANQL